jgi:amidohydrolase
LVNEVTPCAIELRRHIHAHPELSGHEHGTAALVHRRLRELGLSPRYYVGKTGVVATLDGGVGKTVVLRADMDALPVVEETGASFASTIPGAMHACGHDVHTAMLLGAAEALCRMRERVRGRVVFLFQPSEEVEPGGAIRMIDEGAFPRAACAVFGLHVSPDHPAGSVGIKPGSDCGSVLSFDVTIRGEGGHSAIPEKTVDPIVCAAAIVMALQTLVSRECPPVDPAVVSVGSMHAGTKGNVIPDQAVFSGTIRTLSVPLQRRLRTRLTQIVTSVAASMRARGSVAFHETYPPGFNNIALSQWALSELGAHLGGKNVVERPHPSMFAEDFSRYQQLVPGVYVHLGVRPPRAGTRAMHGIHTSRFLPHESAIGTGILTHCVLALGVLGSPR